MQIAQKREARIIQCSFWIMCVHAMRVRFCERGYGRTGIRHSKITQRLEHFMRTMNKREHFVQRMCRKTASIVNEFRVLITILRASGELIAQTW